ncbi:hypothetical protein L596_022737 [Steinernema carpocapsae]|uniref:Uncharacterized protein n=1 Tax=Steinernema carpocapsae TaxID=34508 RepID=A0A4U5MNY6_STECR|nr:hypothetical protein L596_022737 [Steinernema carpocapsae]
MPLLTHRFKACSFWITRKGAHHRDPTAPRRVILSFENGSEFDRVLEGDQFGKAAKNYEDLDKLLSMMPRDLFRITEVTTSLSVILRLKKRFLLRDFTLDQLCELGSKHKHLFDVRRICIDNGDLTDDHQFQKFQQLISVFAKPGTDLRLFLNVGNRLKEVFDVMKAKKLSSKLLHLNAETVEDVKLIQALVLSETSLILSEFLHLQMNIVEQVEKVTFVEFMDNFQLCKEGKLLIDKFSVEFPTREDSIFVEQSVGVKYHPSKNCPYVGYQTLIDHRAYTISLVQTIPAVTVPLDKVKGFYLDNSFLEITAKKGLMIHAEVTPIGRNFSRPCDVLEPESVVKYQIRASDTHVSFWFIKTPNQVPLAAFHCRYFEEPKEYLEVQPEWPFELRII